MNEISIETLRARFIYDPETGVITNRMNGRRTIAGREAGTPHSQGYRAIQINRRCVKSHRIAFAMFYGYWPTDCIDHINGVKNDNRIANLRLATKSENQWNRLRSSTNKSGAKGVNWHKRHEKWQAQIMINGLKKHLGYFRDIGDAAEAYRKASAAIHGEFVNFG